MRSSKINIVREKRSTTNKVKWRDDFEHYDNDSKYFIIFRNSHKQNFALNSLHPSRVLEDLESNSPVVRQLLWLCHTDKNRKLSVLGMDIEE
jgi:hypothetical protein